MYRRITLSYRVGIIGAGGIANCHARAVQELSETELVAICDISKTALNNFGKTFDVPSQTTNLRDMLHGNEIDILIVCTWGNSHAPITVEAAQTGSLKAILCEKPISASFVECQKMIESAKHNNVLLAEAFKFRHHPCHLRVKHLIDTGAIGKIALIRSTFTAAVDPDLLRPDYNWRFNQEKRGGAIFDLGCYCIHHARFIADSEPSKIQAQGFYGLKSKVPESVVLQMEFPNEISAQCAFSFRYYGSEEFEVYGSHGYLRMEKAWNNEDQPVVLEIIDNNGKEQIIKFPPIFQFTEQLKHLCECLNERIPHRIPLHDSLNNMKVIDAVYSSLNSGESTVLA